MPLEYRDILKIVPYDGYSDLGAARRKFALQFLPGFRYERCGDGLSPTADGPALHPGSTFALRFAPVGGESGCRMAREPYCTHPGTGAHPGAVAVLDRLRDGYRR